MGREKQGLTVSPQAEGSPKTPVPFSLAGGFPAYPDRLLQPWMRQDRTWGGQAKLSCKATCLLWTDLESPSLPNCIFNSGFMLTYSSLSNYQEDSC